jgi:hypothetical protein
MKKLGIASLTCAVAAGVMATAGTAGAQTLAVEFTANNYNPSTGVWTDSSGNGNNGTFVNNATLPTLLTGVTANGSDAVDFINTGAASGSFLLANSISPASGYTVLAYFLPNNTGGAQGGGGRGALTGGSNVGGHALEYDQFGGQNDFLVEYTSDVAHGSGTITTGSFNGVGLTVSSGASAFSLNEAPDSTGAGATFSQPITRIGNNTGNGDGFYGELAGIEIYTGSVSQSTLVADETAFDNQFIATPEPTTWAMLIGGFGTLVASRRFRRQA